MVPKLATFVLIKHNKKIIPSIFYKIGGHTRNKIYSKYYNILQILLFYWLPTHVVVGVQTRSRKVKWEGSNIKINYQHSTDTHSTIFKEKHSPILEFTSSALGVEFCPAKQEQELLSSMPSTVYTYRQPPPTTTTHPPSKQQPPP